MKRREQEVGLRRLDDGRWQLDYIDPVSGKRSRSIVMNKTLALQEKRRIEQAMTEGRDPKGIDRRFRDLAAEYIAQYPGLSRKSVETYMRNHVVPYWGDWRLERIGFDDVQAWVTTTLDGGRVAAGTRSAHTISAIFFVFSGAMTYARRKRWIVDTPCVRVKRPPTVERTVSVEAIGDFKAIRAAMPARYRIAATLAVGLGARPNEVVGLTLGQIDLENRTVVIDRQLKRGGYHVPPTWGPPKDKEARTVDVSDAVLDALVAYLADHHTPNQWGLVLADEEGWPLGYYRMNALWNESREDAAATTLKRMHDVRHLSASLAHDGGASLVEIQMRLGHDSVTTTRKYISQLRPRAEASTRAIDAAVLD